MSKLGEDPVVPMSTWKYVPMLVLCDIKFTWSVKFPLIYHVVEVLVNNITKCVHLFLLDEVNHEIDGL
jgi:hypothetical protein